MEYAHAQQELIYWTRDALHVRLIALVVHSLHVLNALKDTTLLEKIVYNVKLIVLYALLMLLVLHAMVKPI